MLPRISLSQPQRLVFGQGCAAESAPHLRRSGCRCAFLVTGPQTRGLAEILAEAIRREGLATEIYDGVNQEPTIAMFDAALAIARAVRPDAVVGIGGGSPLDVAKLVAALLDVGQSVEGLFGSDLLARRTTFLVCLPTTAGTGSEVSPNAILMDESSRLKKGVVSPYLVPDATFVDPLLTVSMPPAVTAATGMDALTHCIEAYTNRFAHPIIDLYALEGIRLIGANLQRAVENGSDLAARESVALGSMYGGLCLGPVNTAAVHALSYPLGGEFHVPHGVSNAVLLPHVMDFNAPACPDRSAEVAVSLGIAKAGTPLETARRGIERVQELARRCGVPLSLSDLGVPITAVPEMAEMAMQVTRLLKNNPRELTLGEAARIYERALQTPNGFPASCD